MPTKKQISEAARALAAKRKTFAGGRPPILQPCPWCRVKFSATELRAHRPRCPQKAA
ncbi:MAG: hypothetical protein ABSA39_16910 [Edaphobacter sp.]